MTKRALSLIAILLLLSILLTACVPAVPSTPADDNQGNAGDTPPDDGADDTEDVPPAKDPNKLYLVDDGIVNFQFVFSYNEISADLRSHIYKNVAALEGRGLTVNAVRDDFAVGTNMYEVLIGTFNGREEHFVSKYTLGNKGYTVRVSGDKIILLGGTEEALKVAFDSFMAECLNFDEGTRSISIAKDYNKTVPETYEISALTVGGVDIRDYSLVCDLADEDAVAAARIMQVRMYDNAGYYLEIVDKTNGGAIYIRSVEKSDADGFRVYAEGGSLYIDCQYPSQLEEQMGKYLLSIINETAAGAVELDTGYSRVMHIVHYRDFGAVGDGVADDFEAIKAAHDFANEYGLAVIACYGMQDAGMTFHLGAHNDTIRIMTDVDWTGASFIIDDTLYDVHDKIRSKSVFSAVSGLTAGVQLTGKLTSLSKDATNIGFTLDQKYLLIIYNDNVKQYIRYGNNADSGAAQQEVILVHENGDIDPSTPLLWNYDTVTSVKMYPASDTPITITGGTFTTIANQAPREYNYYARNISISRSNVTVTGLKHLITGEGDTGAPYTGFLSVTGANNVLFENIVYSGHKRYWLETDSSNAMGTYDISASTSNKITWKNCTQANSITDKELWGIMGSNYCKNLTYDGCTLSRFDAHKGMYNSTIIDSEIGHAGITAIGAGYLRIENTVINSNNAVGLRSDYGSTWDGEIILKDITLKNTSSTVTLISGGWNDHYFGYTCHLPNVVIDNLTVARGTTVNVFANFGNKNIASTSTNNPVAIGGKITIRNNKNGYTFNASANSYIKNAIVITKE